MDIKIITNIEECKKIWDDLVNIKTIYDEWNFRMAFHLKEYDIRFFVGYENNNPVAFLPLQFNKDKKHLEFWGGFFMENNRIYTKQDQTLLKKDLLNSIADKIHIRSMLPEDEFISSLEFDDNTYTYNIGEMKTLEDFMAKGNKKLRKNFRRALKTIEALNPSIEYNNYKNLEILIEYNRKIHGEASSFNDPQVEKGFRALIDSDIDINLMSILFNNRAEAVSFGIQYKNTYYALLSGSNRGFSDNLGNYAKLKSIEHAIKNKFNIVDVGRSDCNWKEKWNMSPHPLYQYKNF